MRKKFVEPEIVKIELNLSENIATSVEDDETLVYGFIMRQAAGVVGGCKKYYVETNHKTINGGNIVDLWDAGCVAPESDAEQQVLMMLRK